MKCTNVYRTQPSCANWNHFAVKRRNARENWRQRITSTKRRSPNCALRWKPSFESSRASWTQNSDLNSRSSPTANCSREKKTGEEELCLSLCLCVCLYVSVYYVNNCLSYLHVKRS